MTVRARVAWWTAAAALLLMGTALLVLSHAGVHRGTADAPGTPLRVIEPRQGAAAPAIVLAHGFAGSAAMLDPLGTALARAGHLVVLPDLPGHGRNAAPLVEGSLSPAVEAAVALAARRSGGPVVVAGHSMGAGAVTDWAVLPGADPRATIAVSLPTSERLPAAADLPANLLLLWGAAEQEDFVAAAREALHLGYPGAEIGRTYGSKDDGSARRAVPIAGAEHITVLYRAATSREIAAWVGSPAEPVGDLRLLGLLLVLAGSVVAVRPIAVGMPEPAAGRGPPPGWGAVGGFAVAAAVAGVGARVAQPLVDGIPVALAGYIGTWFLLGALVMAAAGRRRVPAGTWPGLVAGGLAGCLILAGLAVPARSTWAEFALVGPRPVIAMGLLAVLGAWFWAEARLVWGSTGLRRVGLLAASRILVLVGLLGAVFLLGAPGFLVLTVPVLVPVLALLAVAAFWSRDPASAALAQALPLAAVVATTFPILG